MNFWPNFFLNWLAVKISFNDISPEIFIFSTHCFIFLWKGLALQSFAMWKKIHSMFMSFPEIATGIFLKTGSNYWRVILGHLISVVKKKKKWMTYMLHKIYEWSAFHWCELSNFIIACLLSTNQDGVRKSYFLWKTATSVGVIAHNSKSCKKRAEIWNIDEQGHMV